MEPLRVLILGRFQVRRGKHPLSGFEPVKVQELLTYLILFRDRSISRETLAERLWDENRPRRAKQYLRKALWQLQKGLGESLCRPPEDVLIIEPEWVQFRTSPDVLPDTLQLERAFTSMRDIPCHLLDEGQRRELARIVDLYRGDLLVGCYADWCLIERQRLQILFLALLDKLIGYCTKNGGYEEGIAYGYRVLRHDRARERTHRQLMRLHYLAGNRTHALRQYMLCRETLAEELNVQPSPRTRGLYEALREGNYPAPAEYSWDGEDGVHNLIAALPKLQHALSTTQQALERLVPLLDGDAR